MAGSRISLRLDQLFMSKGLSMSSSSLRFIHNFKVDHRILAKGGSQDF